MPWNWFRVFSYDFHKLSPKSIETSSNQHSLFLNEIWQIFQIENNDFRINLHFIVFPSKYAQFSRKWHSPTLLLTSKYISISLWSIISLGKMLSNGKSIHENRRKYFACYIYPYCRLFDNTEKIKILSSPFNTSESSFSGVRLVIFFFFFSINFVIYGDNFWRCIIFGNFTKKKRKIDCKLSNKHQRYDSLNDLVCIIRCL